LLRGSLPSLCTSTGFHHKASAILSRKQTKLTELLAVKGTECESRIGNPRPRRACGMEEIKGNKNSRNSYYID
jgi:hypothetical protein